MERRLTVLLDGMNIAYAASHAYKRLSYKGKSVSVLFGVPQMVRSVVKNNHWKPTAVIPVWDGERNAHRIEMLPEYKTHRDEKKDPGEKDKFYKEIKKVRKMLYYLGLPQIYDPMVEGDDMMAIAAKEHAQYGKVIIVSGDKDMIQLIDESISVYNQRTSTLITLDLVESMYGIKVNQWVDYLCLVGDKSDDIPGVRGIGEVKGVKFLNHFGSVKEYIKWDKLDTYIFKKLGIPKEPNNIAEICKRNRRLIDLKWFIKKYHKDLQPKYYKGKDKPLLQESKFDSMCFDYRFRTLSTETFKGFFKDLQCVK